MRLRLGLTQEQVCARASLTQGFYCNIENGGSNPSIDALQRISNALEIPVFYLIWAATEKRELNKKTRIWYDNLSPVMEVFIKEII